MCWFYVFMQEQKRQALPQTSHIYFFLGFWSTQPLATERNESKRITKLEPMKNVYLRVDDHILILIDEATNFPFANYMSHGTVDIICEILDNWTAVIGNPKSIQYSGNILAAVEFETYCKKNEIALSPHRNGSNIRIESLANQIIALARYCEYSTNSMTYWLYGIRTTLMFRPRTVKGQHNLSPYELFYYRLKQDTIYANVVNIASKSPSHRFGVAAQSFIKIRGTVEKLVLKIKKPIRFILLGSSNGIRIENSCPQNNIFDIANFENLSLSGLSISKQAGDNYLLNHLKNVKCSIISNNDPFRSFIFVFIGCNNFKYNQYDLYAQCFLKTMEKLAAYVPPKRTIVLTALPRTMNLRLHSEQMNEMYKLQDKLLIKGYKVIQTYEAIPKYLRYPKRLFGLKEFGLRAKHYSKSVRIIISNLISNAIKLEIQDQWNEHHNPWDFNPSDLNCHI